MESSIKWIIFIHGISTNGNLHGKALSTAIQNSTEKSDWNVFFSKASTSYISSYLSLIYTMQGVVCISESILAELDEFFQHKPPITHITIIGASFGGLVARYIAEKMCRLGKWDNVVFESLILLASPNLGVRDLYSGPVPLWILSATSSGNELLWQDESNWLEVLGTRPSYLAAYARFRKRMIYAPVWDDGICSYESTSLLGSPPPPLPPLVNTSPLVLRERHLTAADAVAVPSFLQHTGIDTTQVEETAGAIDAHVQRVSKVMLSMLACHWTLFDVNTDHKVLATLHGAPPASSADVAATLAAKIAASAEISCHIVSML